MPAYLSAIARAAPAIAMLAVFALLVGGAWLVATNRNRGKGVLMLVLAAVIVVNVLLWTLPLPT